MIALIRAQRISVWLFFFGFLPSDTTHFLPYLATTHPILDQLYLFIYLFSAFFKGGFLRVLSDFRYSKSKAKNKNSSPCLRNLCDSAFLRLICFILFCFKITAVLFYFFNFMFFFPFIFFPSNICLWMLCVCVCVCRRDFVDLIFFISSDFVSFGIILVSQLINISVYIR